MKEVPSTCLETRSNLPLYVGQDLDGAIQERVAFHLSECAACRALALGLEATRSRIGVLRADSGEDRDLWPGVRARLLAEGFFGEGRRGEAEAVSTPLAAPVFLGDRRVARRRQALALAAGLAAAAVLGMALLSRSDGPTPVEPAPLAGGPVIDAVPVRSGAMPLADGLEDDAVGPASVQLVGFPAGPSLPEATVAAEPGALRLVPISEKTLLEQTPADPRVFYWPGPAIDSSSRTAGFNRSAGDIR